MWTVLLGYLTARSGIDDMNFVSCQQQQPLTWAAVALLTKHC